jgi:hypothetical protein
VEDKAELDTEDWPAEDFLENDGEGSLNSTGLDKGFSPEMSLLSPSNFESDAQPWSTHATSSQEHFHTRTTFSTIDLPDPILADFMACQSVQASNGHAFAQPQQPLFRTSPLGNNPASATSPPTGQDPAITIFPQNHAAILQTEILLWQWNENSQTISMDQFGLNSEEHTVADVPLQTATNTPDAPKQYEQHLHIPPSPRIDLTFDSSLRPPVP